MKKINHHKRIIITFFTLLVTFSFAATAYAHGVVITYTLKANGEVELFGEFDTGEPMDEAQVTIYSPEDPLNPWLTGVADAEGYYTFVIDPEMPGIWDIQYRKAGHGDIIHMQLEEGLIDPALLSQEPGELLPVAPAAASPAETAAAETEVEAEAEPESSVTAETEAVAVEDEPEAAESAAKSAEEAAEEEAMANNIEMTGSEAEAEIGESSSEETTAAAEADETLSEAADSEASEALAESETEAGPETNATETDTAAQTSAETAASSEETDEVAVLSTGANVGSAGGFTSLQIILMSASVIWGFVGTALYFSGRKSQGHSHTHGHQH